MYKFSYVLKYVLLKLNDVMLLFEDLKWIYFIEY